MESESLRRAVQTVAVMGVVLVATVGLVWSRRRALAGSHAENQKTEDQSSGHEAEPAAVAEQARPQTPQDMVECVSPLRGRQGGIAASNGADAPINECTLHSEVEDVLLGAASAEGEAQQARVRDDGASVPVTPLLSPGTARDDFVRSSERAGDEACSEPVASPIAWEGAEEGAASGDQSSDTFAWEGELGSATSSEAGSAGEGGSPASDGADSGEPPASDPRADGPPAKAAAQPSDTPGADDEPLLLPHQRSVALVTCSASEGSAEDAALGAALRRAGVRAELVPWSESSPAAWERFGLVVVRSAWDATESSASRAAFLQWAAARRAGQGLANPYSALQWGSSKWYLADLAVCGAHVVPTLYLCSANGGSQPVVDSNALARQVHALTGRWPGVVVKPAIGSGARRLRAVGNASRGDRDRAVVQAACGVGGDALVQPYLSSVASHGELSVVLVDGKVTHAVVKRPRRGDCRVQKEFGGTAARVPLTRDQAALAALLGDLLARAVARCEPGQSALELASTVSLASSSTAADGSDTSGAGADGGESPRPEAMPRRPLLVARVDFLPVPTGSMLPTRAPVARLLRHEPWNGPHTRLAPAIDLSDPTHRNAPGRARTPMGDALARVVTLDDRRKLGRLFRATHLWISELEIVKPALYLKGDDDEAVQRFAVAVARSLA